MSILDRSKEVAASVGASARKQAKRAQLEVEARRLKSRIDRQHTAIGRALYPGLAKGAPGSEMPVVQEAVAEIEALQVRLNEKTRSIDELRHPADDVIEADTEDDLDTATRDSAS